MKKYVKPDAEIVDFKAESVTAMDGGIGDGSFNEEE